jgi:hypothetical protein
VRKKEPTFSRTLWGASRLASCPVVRLAKLAITTG